MNKTISLIIVIIMGAAAAFALEKGQPATPLSHPFTAVVNDLTLYGSTAIDGEALGTVPTEVELSFRESEEAEHWIYIDDAEHGVHGWCLDWGGYYGDRSNRDPDITRYQDELDYAITTLGYNPDAYKFDNTNPREGAYAYESAWDKFLKWVIIVLVALAAITAWIPVLPGLLRHGSGLFLAAAGAAEIVYALHFSVFDTYGHNQIFNMFVLGLVQIFAMLMARGDKHIRSRWGIWLSIAGMATVLITATVVKGVSEIVGSILGGLLNLAIGCVVLVVIYAIFHDGLDSGGGSSSDDDSAKKRDGASDGCCGNCSLWNDSTRRCGRYGNVTSYNDHCNGHVW